MQTVNSNEKRVVFCAAELSADGLQDGVQVSGTEPRYIENFALATLCAEISPSKIIRAASSSAIRALP
jgi:hypothetical protein